MHNYQRITSNRRLPVKVKRSQTCLDTYFVKGVDISADGNDMVVTTPYATRANPNRQTLRFKGVKESLKENSQRAYLKLESKAINI